MALLLPLHSSVPTVPTVSTVSTGARVPTGPRVQSFRSRNAWRLATALLGWALATATPSALAELTVQIGAFNDKPNGSFTSKAGEYGEVLALRGDDGVVRVSVGRFDDRRAAAGTLAQLQIAGYADAYITNIRGSNTGGSNVQGSAVANRTSPAPVSNPATTSTLPAAPRVSSTPRTITNSPTSTASASSQRLPSGSQIVVPKQPATQSAETEADAKAGRFRLRTHDTTSGETRDLAVGGNPAGVSGGNPAGVIGGRPAQASGGRPAQVSGGRPAQVSGGTPASASVIPPGVVVAGAGANDIPAHLRDNLVYLDGVPHIKDGERFVPLNDAIDGK